MTAIIDIKTLYESNYLQCLEETIKCLKNSQLTDIDYENLIEELEDLAKNEKRRVRSLLEQIVRHLLLYQYWDLEKPRNANHWAAEITSFRNQYFSVFLRAFAPLREVNSILP